MVDMCERNGGPGRNPLPEPLEAMLAQHLDQPVDHLDVHPYALNERLYLRWLAHRPIEADEATREEFHRRWAARQWQLSG